ncbi:DNA primase [Rhizobium sp. SG_E_25_P2]|uniref:DNA primase n=1 Tax=Rhizobium sp. SG_E_25_P2 TaxID=2879942 RepID=UPI0024734703|nr:DNA primase [Rhizobium sp. SG_E_25_P2]MDH6266916.1 DNA primase [Rhizobium sp. SG_E_25_P2]
MRFSNSFLDELRDRVPISDVIGRRVTWDRKKTNTGRGDYWACCPFHGEKSPSFHCEDRKGRYHCFGCGVSGDHFRFLMELDGVSFQDAVQSIADIAGVSMPAPDPEMARRERERHNLFDVMELATQFFQDQLQTSVGAKARAYLRDRGLTGRTIEAFRLGYSPDSRNALKEYLAGKGVDREQIEACGLVVHGPDIPVSYDRFRDRIMFPILSVREKVIAFGGRALSPDAPAKYLNSNETELFSKGQVLFNHARARRAVQGADTVIAVEGYMDVIALAQAGVDNAVAPLGTALTENQLELLWKMTPVPVLCFDGDGAGLRAASRTVDIALPHLKPGQSLKIALLPDGKDPDDLVKTEGRAPFDKVISESRPLAEMVWLRETTGASFDTPEKRAELEARLKTVTQVIADESVRRHYQQDMRDRLYAFFSASSPQGQARANFKRGQGGGRGGPQRENNSPSRQAPVSDRLAKSGMVSGFRALPSLREGVLAMTIVNHPGLFFEDYDEIAHLEFENRDMQRFWQAVMSVAAASGPGLTREELITALEVQGFDSLLASLEQQIRYARVWIATEKAAIEDAREGYRQAHALHTRARALIRYRHELEREIADAIERGAELEVEQLLSALNENQLESLRLESQEALIDGFGVMSGRVKGPATGH